MLLVVYKEGRPYSYSGVAVSRKPEWFWYYRGCC